MDRLKSNFVAMTAGILIAIAGTQAADACTTFTTLRTSRMEVLFCVLQGWDSSYCYYSCTQIPNATLAF
jgi:hypothetical protein